MFCSWSFISNYIPRISPVHLLGGANISYDVEPHRIYLLWNPEVERHSKCFSEQSKNCRTWTSACITEPNSIYGFHWHCLQFYSWPKGARIYGKFSWWTCKFFLWSSSILSWSYNGGKNKETEEVSICCTHSSHHS